MSAASNARLCGDREGGQERPRGHRRWWTWRSAQILRPMPARKSGCDKRAGVSSRTQFSRRRSLCCATVVAWIIGSFAAASALPRQPYKQVATGIFVREGFCEDASATNLDAIANVGFIVGNNAVAVVDPGGSLADGLSLRAAVRRSTSLPIRFVIMTHAHPDHVFGAAAFLLDRPVFVGHWRLPAALESRGSYDSARLATSLGVADPGGSVDPTLLVHDSIELDLGGRTLKLQAYADNFK